MSLVLKEFLRDQEEHSATYVIIIEDFPKKKNQYISGAVIKTKPFTIRNSLKHDTPIPLNDKYNVFCNVVVGCSKPQDSLQVVRLCKI